MNFEQAIISQLEANANPKQALKMAAYMKNQFVFMVLIALHENSFVKKSTTNTAYPKMLLK